MDNFSWEEMDVARQKREAVQLRKEQDRDLVRKLVYHDLRATNDQDENLIKTILHLLQLRNK